MLDLGNLPNRRGNKKVKHRSSKPRVVKLVLPNPPSQQLTVQIYDVDSFMPTKVIPSKVIAPTSSQPSQRVPMNLIENEDLAWESFQKAMTDVDMATFYNMSLKDFEHFGVHDLFKVCDFTFSLSCHFTLFLSNKLFYLFIYFYFSQCQSSSQHPGRPPRWMRRGYSLRRGSRRLKTTAGARLKL